MPRWRRGQRWDGASCSTRPASVGRSAAVGAVALVAAAVVPRRGPGPSPWPGPWSRSASARRPRGRSRGEHSHWTERAQALLAPLLHAAALADCRHAHRPDLGGSAQGPAGAADPRRREPGRATELARNLLDGIVATDERELSGIWSTASGALAGFRSEHALEVDRRARTSTRTGSSDRPTPSTSRRRPTVRPRSPRWSSAWSRTSAIATFAREPRSADRRPAPVLLALDELANIAPIPDLPSMVSEGGGQGLVTLACLQDLSQARQRWPDARGRLPLPLRHDRGTPRDR